MNRTLTFAIAVGATVATAGVALAQPAYGPNAAAYYDNPYYAPPPEYVAPSVTYPPATTYPYGYYGYTGTHTDGGGSRAYPGGQKTN